MSDPIYIYNPSASPQTGVNTGEYGATLQVKPKPKGAGRSVGVTEENILVTFNGTWGSATIKFYLSGRNESPMSWKPAQVLDPSAGTLSDAVASADGSITLTLPSGTYFTAKITDTASPFSHSITVDALGEIQAV